MRDLASLADREVRAAKRQIAELATNPDRDVIEGRLYALAHLSDSNDAKAGRILFARGPHSVGGAGDPSDDWVKGVLLGHVEATTALLPVGMMAKLPPIPPHWSADREERFHQRYWDGDGPTARVRDVDGVESTDPDWA